MRPGLLIIISSPSGGGKTTLCNRLLQWDKNLTRVVTCTTRPPRPGEQHGVHYHFLSKEEFERRIAAGHFLEHAEYNGHCYGTPRQFVEDVLRSGRDALLAIEVQGARQITRLVRSGKFPYPDSLVTIFLFPPTLGLLEQRLRRRGQDDEQTLQRRLQIARQEIAYWREYDYTIVTGDIEDDLMQAKAILIAEKCRTHRFPDGGQPWLQKELLHWE
ncbi:MAG: guanylate kinase [Verrucomicrobiae bacterium]|nr:guanylate kinase [Verrucomicrobiae bacterium]